MRSLLYLSLALNFLLFGYYFYINSNNYLIPKSSFDQEILTSEQILSASKSFRQLVGSLTDSTNTTTKPIELARAKLLHHYYVNNKCDEGADSTEAVIFNLRVILGGLYNKTASSAQRESDFVDLLLKTDINCYLAMYPKSKSSRESNPVARIARENQEAQVTSPIDENINSGQTTLILQLSDCTVDTIYPGQIYNYGKKCPPKCPVMGLNSIGEGG